MVVGPVAYHDYQGILVDLNERESLATDMGKHNVRAMKPGDVQSLTLPSNEAARQVHETASRGGGGVNRKDGAIDERWRIGELEWQAWMRVLDDMKLQTGYEHRPIQGTTV
ncbi:unnamed protein product [Nippostrongylus brasiliensis]|uniref:MOSC domain-containing protein n=1 Tax=Nippostrongylus brasiliensis TaxID=27835 RepID=A0A0N4YXX6_NIPBR|nr:unnamed protein product [Nippostrongylus brasiliensis]